MSGAELNPAVLANALLAERFHVAVGATEGAGIGHLFDDYRSPFHGDVEMVPFADIEQFARLSRDHDPPQIVNFSGDSTVHVTNPPGASSLHRSEVSLHSDWVNQ